MIKIKRVTEFPWELPLGEIASREIGKNAQLADIVVARSRCWIIYWNDIPLFMAGVMKLSLIGSATRLWLITFEGFKRHFRRVLKFMLRGTRLIRRCVGPLSLTVDDSSTPSKNFATLIGFERSVQSTHEFGTNYRYYFLR